LRQLEQPRIWRRSTHPGKFAASFTGPFVPVFLILTPEAELQSEVCSAGFLLLGYSHEKNSEKSLAVVLHKLDCFGKKPHYFRHTRLPGFA